VVLTYDASTDNLALHTNGDRADTVHVNSAATVDGPFVLGANQTDKALGSYLPGEIARVVTFDTTLTNQEVKQLP
jgi:Concanavalin A-like lectin/glucanases superfamily